MPSISVILPVRNGACWIGEALQSVAVQSRLPDEILVIDGQSSDDSAAIAAQFDRVRVVRQPDLGVAAGLNLGFAEARGDYLAMISCDDRWHPEKLAMQAGLLDSDPALDVVFGRICFFADAAPPPALAHLIGGCHAGHLLEVMMIRREVAMRTGPFRSDLSVATDVDWFARLAEAGARKAMPEAILLDKRLRPESNSADPARTQAELLRALRDAVGRRRAAHG